MKKTKEKYSPSYLKNPTCRFFNGYKPCPIAKQHNTICPSPYCLPVGDKLLIIEMGGIGSVLRTTIVTKEFKKLHNPSHITFLTNLAGVEVLKFSPSIDRILEFTAANILILLAEKFDYVYNFEVEPEARSLCSLIYSQEKYGFGMNKNGLPKIMHKASADLFRFQIDDSFRESNQKSIQQLLLESVGMKWGQQKFDIELDKQDIDKAEAFIKQNKLTGNKIIGLNIGSKKKHAKKRWYIKNFILLAKNLCKMSDVKSILLGGSEEKEIYHYAMSHLKDEGIMGNGYNNTTGEFLALLSKCDVVVSATTFGLLAAIGLGVKTVAICAPKPISEIYTYGRGIKIAYSAQYDPEYSTKIPSLTPREELEIGIKDIPVEIVLSAVHDALNNNFENNERFVKL